VAWLRPEPLNVAPALVGQPLAPPLRRLWALGLDLLAVALLSSLSNLWLLGGLGLVVLLLRSDRGSTRWRRGVGWAFATLLLVLALEQLLMWRGWHPFNEGGPPAPSAQASAPSATASAPPPASLPAQAASVAELGRLMSAQVVDVVAPAVPTAAPKTGRTPPQARADAQDQAGPADPSEPPGDSAEARMAQAVRAVALQGLGVPARAASATDAQRVQQLEEHLLQRDGDADEPAAAPITGREFSLKRWLDDGLDSLGVSFAWGIVYFSLLPALWGGQTLGKKLLRLRVVELTGQPITVMRALRRYGGYAAGMATGGLGFLQVLFDPNRQGIQDRTAHTVVLDVGQPPLPPPPPSPSSSPSPSP
jgi:hypothetical protein